MVVRIQSTIPQTKETKQFFALLRRGIYTGFAQAFGPVGWDANVKSLRDRYEQDGNLDAVGILAGATRGTKARPEWVSEAIEKAADDGKQVRMEGSGRQKTTPREQKRGQDKKRHATSRDADNAAEKQLNQQLCKRELRAPKYPRQLWRERIKWVLTEKLKIIDEALHSADPHKRHAAKKIKPRHERQLAEVLCLAEK